MAHASWLNWKLAKLKKSCIWIHIILAIYFLINVQCGRSLMLHISCCMIPWNYPTRNKIIDRPLLLKFALKNVKLDVYSNVFLLSNYQFSIFVAIVFKRKKLDGMINDSSVFLWSLSKGTLEWYYEIKMRRMTMRLF